MAIAKTTVLATISDECDTNSRDGGSVEGLGGKDGGVTSTRKEFLSSSKKRTRDVEKDEEDTKKSKVVKLKLN